MKIIDAHQHFWKRETLVALELPPERSILVNDYGPADLWPLLKQAGVQQTVLVQTQSSLRNTYEFLQIAEVNDWIGGVVGWVNLADPRVGDVLDALQEHPKFKGVRHQWEAEPAPAWPMRPDVLRGLRELAKRGIPYDLLVKPRHWPYISELAAAVPDLWLVIDHIGKPDIRQRQFDSWVIMMTGVVEFPRIMAKLSGMITEADWHRWRSADLKPYVDRVIELLGVDRVMYGSDWPVCLLAGSYGQVFHAMEECVCDLSEGERGMVFGGNAMRFYGLV